MSERRHRARELAFAAFMLGCVAMAHARGELRWCTAGGLVALGVRLMTARGAWTPSGRFGLANALTLARLALVAALPDLFLALPRLAFAGLVVVVLLLDGADGWLARARGEASAFGAAFDMETDALSVMVLGLVAWRHGLVGPWVLIAGLWRYVYAATVAIVPSLGEAPRSRFGRGVFTVLMLCLAAVFLPWPPLPAIAAAIGTVLVSISFLVSLARSRALAQPNAARNSRAASAQERRGTRAA